MERYWLRIPGLKWQEVTKDRWIETEGKEGLKPKPNCGPFATLAFSTGTIEDKRP